MTAPITLTLNQPINLVYGSKEGTGNIQFMGGSFYVTNLDPVKHLEGHYTGATLACNLFQGSPSPRQVLELHSGEGAKK